MAKRKSHPKPPKPEFAMTGLVIGVSAGMAVGLAIEIIKRRNMIVMQLGGIAGLVAGALAELMRLWWRKSHPRKPHEEVRSPGGVHP